MASSAHATVGSSHRVLLVDDDRLVNQSLARKFARRGWDPTSAFDGSDALRQLAQSKFDAVVLDLIMPIEDGYAVLAQRRATPNASVPIYVLTTVGQDDQIAHARELGARQVYFKSETSPKQVVEQICADLERQ